MYYFFHMTCRKISDRESDESDQESPSSSGGIGNELILILVFERLNWDIHALCRTASVSSRLRALAKRLLWRRLCLHRAPAMASSLTTEGSSTSRIIGGWPALAKLMFFCSGCGPPSPGHFLRSARFSKTSGRSFLIRRCRGDDLYVSDPCEHRDVGLYRGVFRSFRKSRTREFLIRKQVGFEAGVRCPYCGARVWSMAAARMVPARTAARRLGSVDGAGLEYFVCLNGHLHGACWLVHLSSDDEESSDGVVDLTDDGSDVDQVSSHLLHHDHMEVCSAAGGKILIN